MAGDAIEDLNNAQNLLDLAPNGFHMDIQYSSAEFRAGPWHRRHFEHLKHAGNTLSYTYNLNGTYGGPTDLAGVTGAGFRWTPGDGRLLETGTASVARGTQPPLMVNWTAEYTYNGTALPFDEIAKLNYTQQNWSASSGTDTFNVAYNGYIQPANDAATWTGGDPGGSNNWSKPNNWGGTALAPGAALKFGPLTSGQASNYNDLTTTVPYNGIAFLAGAPAYNLTGNSIALAGPVVNTGTSNQTISLNMALASGGGAFDTGTGTITVAGAISDPMPAGPATSLTKYGTGTLILAGPNTYSGSAFVNEGQLVLGSATPWATAE